MFLFLNMLKYLELKIRNFPCCVCVGEDRKRENKWDKIFKIDESGRKTYRYLLYSFQFFISAKIFQKMFGKLYMKLIKKEKCNYQRYYSKI